MYGLDLSHHQNPAALDWARFNGVVDFVIARSSYGAKLRDRHCAQHIARARAIGAKVGLYHFFRDIHDVRSQWDLLRSVADQVGITEGDIVPAIDIERDPMPSPGRDVSPQWSSKCQELVNCVVEEFGDCLVYITQREFRMMGSPSWVLERPLWVAHYVNAAKPASPANQAPHIWQHRVARFDPNGPGGHDKAHPELDQNRGLKPLPLVAHPSDSGIEELLEEQSIVHDEVDHIDEAAVMATVARTIDDEKREFFEGDWFKKES